MTQARDRFLISFILAASLTLGWSATRAKASDTQAPCADYFEEVGFDPALRNNIRAVLDDAQRVVLDSLGDGAAQKEKFNDYHARRKVELAVNCMKRVAREFRFPPFQEKMEHTFWSVVESLGQSRENEQINPFGTSLTREVVAGLERAQSGAWVNETSQQTWSRLLTPLLIADTVPFYRKALVQGWIQGHGVQELRQGLAWLGQKDMGLDVKVAIVSELRHFNYPFAWDLIAGYNPELKQVERSALLDVLGSGPHESGDEARLRNEATGVALELIEGSRGSAAPATSKFVMDWFYQIEGGSLDARAKEDLWIRISRTLMADDTRMSWLYFCLVKNFEDAQGPVQGKVSTTRRAVAWAMADLLKHPSPEIRNRAVFFLISGWAGVPIRDRIRAELMKKTEDEIYRERRRIIERGESAAVSLISGIFEELFGRRGTGQPYVYEYRDFPRMSDGEVRGIHDLYDRTFPTAP